MRYGTSIRRSEERFDAAVELTIEQWSESQSLPFEQVAVEAVHEVFCGCIKLISTAALRISSTRSSRGPSLPILRSSSQLGSS